MGLVFLGGPSVPNPVGSITRIVNAKDSGAQGMDWSFEQTGGWFQAQRKYTNTLRVFTSSAFVGSIQIQQAVLGLGCFQGAYYRFPLPELNGDAGLPVSIVEKDTGSFAQTINIKQDSDDARQWLVTISYSSFDINHEFGSSQTQDGSINPLEMAPDVHWSSAKYEVAYAIDVNGKPFRNTVGDPLENPPTVEESRQVLTFVRNEQQYVEAWAQQYRDTTNSDNFLGYAPNQVKCKDIQGKRIYTADYGYYWQVSYEFEFRVGNTTTVLVQGDDPIAPPVDQQSTTGWNTEILNAGLRQLVGGTGDPQQITINGALVTSPVCLQQDGSYNPDPNLDPYYLQFQQYLQMPFAFLNIPDDVLTQSQ